MLGLPAPGGSSSVHMTLAYSSACAAPAGLLLLLLQVCLRLFVMRKGYEFLLEGFEALWAAAAAAAGDDAGAAACHSISSTTIAAAAAAAAGSISGAVCQQPAAAGAAELSLLHTSAAPAAAAAAGGEGKATVRGRVLTVYELWEEQGSSSGLQVSAT
jgi:hypothetical protein